MKLQKYYKFRELFETFNFEKNFSSLSRTLYYFSFLGNIFLVLFSYFFIKNVTDSIPKLFNGQGIFFSIFVILFMSLYELFKRFAFEQLTSTILRVKKVTINIILGILVSLALVSGSFYLSLNGAHRLIDTTHKIETKLDTLQTNVADSISQIYQKRIDLKEQQIQAIQDNDANGVLNNSQRNVIKQLEADVKQYEQERDQRISAFENKSNNKVTKQEDTIKENSFAFAMLVFFLEFIILIGVAFNAYYKWTSFSEMKKVLSTPQFKKLELNLQLLKLYFQNGRKKEGDITLSASKFKQLVSNNKINCHIKDITEFLVLCGELEITSGTTRKKIYNISYDKAKELLENQQDNLI